MATERAIVLTGCRISKTFAFCLIATSFFLSACGIFDRSDEKVVITVGKRNVTPDELKTDIKFVTFEIGIPDQSVKNVLKPLVDRVVDHYLILEYGKEKGITVSTNELEAAVKDIRKDYPDKVFQEMLLHRYVDFEEWLEGLKQQLLIKKIIGEASQNIAPVTFHEVKTYFESHQDQFMRPRMVKFRQVVTRTKDEAKKILQRLRDGDDFDGLARMYSVAPEAENGGVVGWIAQGELEESMEKVIFSLPVGRISPVVRTPYGYHIFEVLSKRSEGLKSLPEAMAEIESTLSHEKTELFYQRWLKELRGHYPVSVNNELLNTLEFG
ncbi:MAG: peptidylprolyl isomerase [Desulfatiglandales bacterium]